MPRRYGYRDDVLETVASLVLVAALLAVAAGAATVAYRVYRSG